MKMSLPKLNIHEKVIVLAILLNHFSYWPTLVVNDADKSGLEFAMLSGVLISLYTIFKFYRELYNFIRNFTPLLWLFAWFAYGSIVSLLLTNSPSKILLDIGYLGSVLLAFTSVAFLVKAKKAKIDNLLKGWVSLAAVVMIFAAIQYLASASGGLSLINDSYGAGVFAFPRIHAFAFEPLFLANWLLPPLVYLAYRLSSDRATGRHILLVGIAVVFFLTLSRGGFIALAVVLGSFVVRAKSPLLYARSLTLVFGAALLIALSLVGVSANLNGSSFTNGIGRYLDHATLGVFNQEGANNVTPKTVTEADGTTSETFVVVEGVDTEGAVEGSTKGRIEAGSTAWNTFTDSPKNMLLGIGLFRFGEEANSQNPEIFASAKQQSNNQLLDVLVETGLVGAILLAAMIWVVVKKYQPTRPVLSFMLVAMLVQYLTFSSYFPVSFWIVLGLMFGSLRDARIKT